MKGLDVKEKLVKEGYALNEVAKNMNISPQTLHSLLKAGDIKTGVLENIANAINKTIYFFYEEYIEKQKQNGNKKEDDTNFSKLIDVLSSAQENNANLIENASNLIINNSTLTHTNEKLADAVIEQNKFLRENVSN